MCRVVGMEAKKINKIRENRTKQEMIQELGAYQELEVLQRLNILRSCIGDDTGSKLLADILNGSVDDDYIDELESCFEKVDYLFDKRVEDDFFEELENRRQKTFR